MNNLVYDILESQIKKEIDDNIQKLGVRTHNISIDADVELSIKIVLISNELNVKNIS